MYIVHSRPLTTQQLTSGVSVEPLPLTPNNLLTMKDVALLSSPGTFDQSDMYSRKCWRRVQYLAEQFWSRWKVEYLQSLQTRSKWWHSQPNIAKNDIVLMVENEQPRSLWQLAKVLKVFKGSDGLCRRAEIKTGSGQLLERPVHKLIVLVASTPAKHVE